jgi:hypothetical protein
MKRERTEQPKDENQTKVIVSFDFYPDDPDPDDPTGMGEEEFEQLTRNLSDLGADNIEFEVVKQPS